MKKTKVRSIPDKDLTEILVHHDRALFSAGRAYGQQRSFNRWIVAAIVLLYLAGIVHMVYFHYAGYYAWVWEWMGGLW